MPRENTIQYLRQILAHYADQKGKRGELARFALSSPDEVDAAMDEYVNQLATVADAAESMIANDMSNTTKLEAAVKKLKLLRGVHWQSCTIHRPQARG